MGKFRNWSSTLTRIARPTIEGPGDHKAKPLRLNDIARDIRKNSIRVLVYGLVGFLLGVLYLIVSPHSYGITAELIPVPDWLSAQPQSGGSGLSSLLQPNSVDFGVLFESSLQNKAVYEELDKKMDARKYVFSDMWDEQTKSWHVPSGPMGLAKSGINFIRWIAGYPDWNGPTIDDLQNTLTGRIKITRNSDGSILLEMKSRHPSKDRAMLNFILNRSDELVRAQMISYVKQTIEGLQNQLMRVSETSLRDAVIQKIAVEMTAEASLANNRITTLNFIPIETTDFPIYPSVKGTLIVGILFGLLFPIGWMFLLRSWR
ncbi:MAG TPA: hypothetical protein VIM56_07940 [Rhizomicrobium sp.]